MAPKSKNNGTEEKEDSFTKASPANSGKINKTKTGKNSYSLYIHKVLKQIHPDIGISNKAVNTIDSLVNDILNQIAEEASRLAKQNKKSTVSSEDIQSAVKVVLPGELAKHAQCEETKATKK